MKLNPEKSPKTSPQGNAIENVDTGFTGVSIEVVWLTG
jgi:hypothetical protein